LSNTVTEPLVSISISVYNAGEYLRPSVKSIIDQTYTNLEIIIIDDGSTDGCMESIADLNDARVRIITQKNAGKPVALNCALAVLSGEFYAIQDADDVSYPTRIERQVQCMLENPKVAAVFTGYDIILNGRRQAPRFPAKSVQQCQHDIEKMGMPSHDPTVMFRMSMVSGLSYEPSLRVGQGWDYILRVGEKSAMMVLGECLYSYRVHFDSITRTDSIRRNQKVQDVLKLACQRRGLDFSEYFPSSSVLRTKSSHREQEIGVVPHFIESVLDLRRARRFRDSLATAISCLRLHPWAPYYYKPLVYFLAPLKIIEYYRSWKNSGRHI